MSLRHNVLTDWDEAARRPWLTLSIIFLVMLPGAGLLSFYTLAQRVTAVAAIIGFSAATLVTIYVGKEMKNRETTEPKTTKKTRRGLTFYAFDALLVLGGLVIVAVGAIWESAGIVVGGMVFVLLGSGLALARRRPGKR